MRQFKSFSALALCVFVCLSKRPSLAKVRRWLLCMMLSLTMLAGVRDQETTSRKLRSSVPPEYPELARKMNIQGVARVLLTVTTDGRVVGVKELGGNPVLIAALVQAVKKWKYEPADRESEIEVRFEFAPGH